MKLPYRCLLSAVALLIAAAFFILAAMSFLIVRPGRWTSMNDCAQKLGCPIRNTEELETSVKEYFESDFYKGKSFVSTIEFYPAENSYTGDSALWGVPFSMVDAISNERKHMDAIVDCNGRVEISGGLSQ